MRRSRCRLIGGAVLTAVLAAASLQVPAAGATSGLRSSPDSGFYAYSGATPLARYSPGAVLKSRSVSLHLAGIALPLHVTQLLYRSVDAMGRPTADVTSVIKPPVTLHPDRAIAYQSFYDSLNPEDAPSRAIAGGLTPGGSIATTETALITSFLLQGYPVIMADTEGPAADFAAGPEYGKATLDSIRAASIATGTGVSRTARIGLIGYSGGAIATGWAAALAPSYAPEVNKRIVGAAEGGVLVDPDHNLHYIQGSLLWAGVLVMALIGVSRAYGIDLTPYLNAYGQSVFAKLKNASITSALGGYPGLTWAKIAKPQYAEPEDVPIFVRTVNKLNLGSIADPTVPMFIGQGADGVLEGTPGFGKGDGVMVAADVRSLARKYCASGSKVLYRQYDATSHVTSVPLWLPEAMSWLSARFGGSPAPQNCASIPSGNSLAPIPTPAG